MASTSLSGRHAGFRPPAAMDLARRTQRPCYALASASHDVSVRGGRAGRPGTGRRGPGGSAGAGASCDVTVCRWPAGAACRHWYMVHGGSSPRLPVYAKATKWKNVWNGIRRNGPHDCIPPYLIFPPTLPPSHAPYQLWSQLIYNY